MPGSQWPKCPGWADQGSDPPCLFCKPTQTSPLSLLLRRRKISSPRLHKASQNRVVPKLVPCCCICSVLSFPLKEVSQGRGASGPVWLRYQDLQRPVSQASQASSQRALLALRPALGPSGEQSPGCATARFHPVSPEWGWRGRGMGGGCRRLSLHPSSTPSQPSRLWPPPRKPSLCKLLEFSSTCVMGKAGG